MAVSKKKKRKKTKAEGLKVAQSEKCLPHKHEFRWPVPILKTKKNQPGTELHACNYSTGKEDSDPITASLDSVTDPVQNKTNPLQTIAKERRDKKDTRH